MLFTAPLSFWMRGTIWRRSRSICWGCSCPWPMRARTKTVPWLRRRLPRPRIWCAANMPARTWGCGIWPPAWLSVRHTSAAILRGSAGWRSCSIWRGFVWSGPRSFWRPPIWRLPRLRSWWDIRTLSIFPSASRAILASRRRVCRRADVLRVRKECLGKNCE